MKKELLNKSLHHSITAEDFETCESLLKLGANPNYSFKGYTNLCEAFFQGNLELAQLLISLGGQMDNYGTFDFSPLMASCISGDMECVDFCINAGNPINHQSKFKKYSPLMLASMCGHKNIVLELLKQGADPTLENIHGDTAFSLAFLNDFIDVEKILEQYLESGQPIDMTVNM